MTRRFPPAAVGLPTNRAHYRDVLQVVADADGKLTWDEFRTRCHQRVRKPDSGEQYGDAWIRRLTTDMHTSGFVRRQTATVSSIQQASDTESHRSNGSESTATTNEIKQVTLWPTGRQWLAGDRSFASFIWRSLKRGWVVEGNAPEKIEALERVTHVVQHANDPCSKSEIETRLREDHDYTFNDLGVRGYPKLLTQMGAIRETEDGYATSEDTDSYLSKFRDADLFREFESWIRKEGVTGQLPGETTKRDMMKYYMYRESEGWGKQTHWLKPFWREYLDKRSRDGETANPHLKRSRQYLEAEDRREKLRETIKSKHDFGSSELSGLPTEVLSRIAEAESTQEAHRIRIAAGSGISRSDLETLHDPDRDDYTFPAEFSLYDWQAEAAAAWRADESTAAATERGIAQVVTGAGKTVMALETIRDWLSDHDDGIVTVLVPTRVLMKQWLTELLTKLNVPPEDIGWAGDGQRDAFSDGRRIVVSIVNTAVRDGFLRTEIQAAGSPPHYLIADECHRYTGDVFSNVFDYHRTASLGLSATPVSTAGMAAEEDLTPEDEQLIEELGEIYYELTYDEALERNLISQFEVNYIGFELTDRERRIYDQYTRKLSNAISDIESRYGERLFQLSGSYSQKLQVIRNNSDGPTPAISDYFEFTQDRRELIADAVARQAITLELLRTAIDDEKKTIVFQERIEQLEQLIAPFERRDRNPRTGELTAGSDGRQELYETYPELREVDLAIEELFDDADFWPVMYHSGHSRDRWNDFAMEWFRDDDFANVMLSVKALIEGVDVPSADVGIIRVSNSSLRQRIQTFGRVLRTGGDASKKSQLFVLYARDTVDERLFKEYDWDEQLASATVNHYHWEPQEGVLDGELVETNEPLPSGGSGADIEIPDADELDRGDPYEGPRGRFKFSVDSDGNPYKDRKESREFITNPELEEIAAYVHELKGGGTVMINEADHVTTTGPDGQVFLGCFAPDDLEYETDESSNLTDDAPDSLDFM
jgi:superfamily II DNA or RNA helicase